MYEEATNTMKERDIFEEIKDLGTRRGILTYSEINDAFPLGSLFNDELEDFLDLLQEIGVKVVDSQEAGFEVEEPLEEEEEEPEEQHDDEK